MSLGCDRCFFGKMETLWYPTGPIPAIQRNHFVGVLSSSNNLTFRRVGGLLPSRGPAGHEHSSGGVGMLACLTPDTDALDHKHYGSDQPIA